MGQSPPCSNKQGIEMVWGGCCPPPPPPPPFHREIIADFTKPRYAYGSLLSCEGAITIPLEMERGRNFDI